MKTTTINWHGEKTTAYAERQATWNTASQDYSAERIAVRVYDDVAGHYVESDTITEGQRRYIIGRTLDK